ncbi:sigma factor [Actinoplanes sp. M2I2]|uniref:sigma factor n=1 Tax=Actinoplanes sp. M2I2 TaxID=1734444 RepID=UPI002022407B|nr:sigma factor [Actinoplanes sp. M2I2]
MNAVEAAFREHRGPLLATLVAELRSFDLAEDAVQDAFAAATRQWPGEGVPRRPAAWLLSVARRRAVDRREEALAAFDRALSLAPTDTESDHLRRRRGSVSGTGTEASPVPVPASEHPF